ncbi:KAP family NTPase [Vibrio chagasii]|nr:KAP family NTPase [Vibrio chagasii]
MLHKRWLCLKQTLNGGAGKTYFISRWIDSIKDTHPVVYVDAWKQDILTINNDGCLFFIKRPQ